MKNRRSFLTGLVALVAAPVVPAAATSGKVQGRGMTSAFYAIDEAPYFKSPQPLTGPGALSMKHLDGSVKICYVDDSVAKATDIQSGYYLSESPDFVAWKKTNGYEVDEYGNVYVVRKRPEVKVHVYDPEAVKLGASLYPRNLYGEGVYK